MSAVETELAELWRKVLGVETVGRRDNCSELGGHSLSAIKVMVAIRNQYGVRLSFKTLMAQTDIAAIAGQLKRFQDDTVAAEI